MTELAQLSASIGARVRSCRTGRGWTLDELAERSGVSRRMLVNIEQGRTNPSIATLLRLSEALGVGLPLLVEVAGPQPLKVTRAGQAPVLWRGPLGGRAILAAGSQPPNVVELWDWTLAPGEVHYSDAHSTGTLELLLIVAGYVDLQSGGVTVRLSAGDSAFFPGDQRHSYGNPDPPGERPARFALTVFQPGGNRRCAVTCASMGGL